MKGPVTFVSESSKTIVEEPMYNRAPHGGDKHLIEVGLLIVIDICRNECALMTFSLRVYAEVNFYLFCATRRRISNFNRTCSLGPEYWA